MTECLPTDSLGCSASLITKIGTHLSRIAGIDVEAWIRTSEADGHKSKQIASFSGGIKGVGRTSIFLGQRFHICQCSVRIAESRLKSVTKML